MKKHEHPTNRLEKMSNFFGGGNFSKLNLYPPLDKISLLCYNYKNITKSVFIA